MQRSHYALAVTRWRDQLEAFGGGLDAVTEKATISTMLFACNQWLVHHGAHATVDERTRIEVIKAELESWLAERGFVASAL